MKQTHNYCTAYSTQFQLVVQYVIFVHRPVDSAQLCVFTIL
jgi:hypothetical protein